MKTLRNFRKERGLSMKDIADLMKVSLPLYSMVENDVRKPSQNFLQKFKDSFPECDMNIFFEKDTNIS